MRLTIRWMVILSLGVSGFGFGVSEAQFMNQSGFDGAGIGAVGGRWHMATLGDASVTRFYPVKEEVRRATDSHPVTNTDAEHAKPDSKPPADRGGQSRDGYVKRQGWVRVLNVQMIPQPNLRHATERFESFDTNERVHELRLALEKPMRNTFEFNELPLRDVITQIRDSNNIPVQLDVKALEDAGVDLDTPITQNLSGITLRSALRLLLGNIDLTYLIKNEVLMITTIEKAQENLVVRVYPVADLDKHMGLVDLIQSTVAQDSWDTTGGPGAIRLDPVHFAMVISQTQEVHEEIEDFVRKLLDGDTSPGALADASSVPMRIHAVRDEKILQELQQSLIAVCNAALGAAGDPEAKVFAIGGRLVVQSHKRSFQVYATEMIHAVNGVYITTPEYFGVSGSKAVEDAVGSVINMTGSSTVGGTVGGLGGMCWVAREVYGPHDPRWLAFREWMLSDAPIWLRDTYSMHGESFAKWLRDKPVAKAVVRHVMDAVVSGDPASAGGH